MYLSDNKTIVEHLTKTLVLNYKKEHKSERFNYYSYASVRGYGDKIKIENSFYYLTKNS